LRLRITLFRRLHIFRAGGTAIGKSVPSQIKIFEGDTLAYRLTAAMAQWKFYSP